MFMNRDRYVNYFPTHTGQLFPPCVRRHGSITFGHFGHLIFLYNISGTCKIPMYSSYLWHHLNKYVHRNLKIKKLRIQTSVTGGLKLKKKHKKRNPGAFECTETVQRWIELELSEWEVGQPRTLTSGFSRTFDVGTVAYQGSSSDFPFFVIIRKTERDKNIILMISRFIVIAIYLFANWF